VTNLGKNLRKVAIVGVEINTCAEDHVENINAEKRVSGSIRRRLRFCLADGARVVEDDRLVPRRTRLDNLCTYYAVHMWWHIRMLA
jgi:hypothetical protein